MSKNNQGNQGYSGKQKSNQGNQGYSGKQKRVIQGQIPDTENRHTQQRTLSNLNHN